MFGILGPNGAGKTTTVECVAGLRVPDSGIVRVGGLDPRTDRAELTRLLGVQLQESRLQAKITVSEAMRLWSALYADPLRWHDLVERLGLEGQATRSSATSAAASSSASPSRWRSSAGRGR